MSLAIDPDLVRSVLLTDGIWYTVALNDEGDGTFDIDAYEFLTTWENPPGHQKSMMIYGPPEGADAAGFHFLTTEGVMYGPMTAILALRY